MAFIDRNQREHRQLDSRRQVIMEQVSSVWNGRYPHVLGALVDDCWPDLGTRLMPVRARGVATRLEHLRTEEGRDIGEDPVLDASERALERSRALAATGEPDDVEGDPHSEVESVWRWKRAETELRLVRSRVVVQIRRAEDVRRSARRRLLILPFLDLFTYRYREGIVGVAVALAHDAQPLPQTCETGVLSQAVERVRRIEGAARAHAAGQGFEYPGSIALNATVAFLSRLGVYQVDVPRIREQVDTTEREIRRARETDWRDLVDAVLEQQEHFLECNEWADESALRLALTKHLPSAGDAELVCRWLLDRDTPRLLRVPAGRSRPYVRAIASNNNWVDRVGQPARNPGPRILWSLLLEQDITEEAMRFDTTPPSELTVAELRTRLMIDRHVRGCTWTNGLAAKWGVHIARSQGRCATDPWVYLHPDEEPDWTFESPLIKRVPKAVKTLHQEIIAERPRRAERVRQLLELAIGKSASWLRNPPALGSDLSGEEMENLFVEWHRALLGYIRTWNQAENWLRKDGRRLHDRCEQLLAMGPREVLDEYRALRRPQG